MTHKPTPSFQELNETALIILKGSQLVSSRIGKSPANSSNNMVMPFSRSEVGQMQAFPLSGADWGNLNDLESTTRLCAIA
jgi:hypothetical protein